MSDQRLPTPEACPTVGSMPQLGLGTWKNSDPEQCSASVATALDVGYRHIDTAQAYGNEQAVGVGIERSEVDRDDVFLATKIWIDNLEAEDVHETARTSLDRLGVDSVDLLYVHWPSRTYDPIETLGAFNQLVSEGLVDHIGVSNFTPEQVEAAVEISDAPILANQVEIHPLFQQTELREACADLGVEPVAYSPLARGGVSDIPELRSIAGTHGVSPAQVSLAWLRQEGITAVPKATSAAHIRDNWHSLSVTLSDDELETIRDIEQQSRLVDPDFGPWNG